MSSLPLSLHCDLGRLFSPSHLARYQSHMVDGGTPPTHTSPGPLLSAPREAQYGTRFLGSGLLRHPSASLPGFT